MIAPKNGSKGFCILHFYKNSSQYSFTSRVFFLTSHHKLFTIAFPGIRANVQNYYAITHAYIFHFFSQLTQKDTIPNIFK